MRILNSFLMAWILYWLLQVILPVRPVGEALLVGFMVQIAFVLTVAGTYALAEHWPVGPASAAGWTESSTVVAVALALSLIGTLALAFDKVVIQGIDYSAGLAFAREQWRESGVARGNEISSPASVVGYLLSSCYIVAIVLFARTNFAGRTYLYGAMAAILALANTVLTGGRSTLILTLLFFVAARLLAGNGVRIREKTASGRRSLWLTLALVFFGGIYFLFVFLQRADATGISVVAYSRSVLNDLGLEPTAWLEGLDPEGILAGPLNLLVMATAYFTHSFSTTVAIADFGPEHNFATVVFVTAASLAAKLHLIGPIDTEWFLAGAFPSLPGALFLQGGWFLLLFASAALGLLTSLAQSWYRASPSALSFGVLAAFLCVLLASPILFVADVMMFPFVMLQFGLISLIAKLIK